MRQFLVSYFFTKYDERLNIKFGFGNMYFAASGSITAKTMDRLRQLITDKFDASEKVRDVIILNLIPLGDNKGNGVVVECNLGQHGYPTSEE